MSVRLPGALVALGVGLSACGPVPTPPVVHDGPIVLITIDTLRADVVSSMGGRPGLTPHLDGLVAESTWSGRSVATSSWTVPSMASIFTGLQPWRHGSWHGEQALLQEDLETLPEALRSLGYRTSGFRSNRWLTPQFGYAQGFDSLGNFDRFKRLQDRIAAFDGGRDFLWVHILQPHAPYIFREHLVSRFEHPRDDLPPRLRPMDLEPYFDPDLPMSTDLRAQAWELYEMNVAFSDERLGGVLGELRASPHWDSMVVVVTSDHGEEFEENGQVLHGGNLHRVLIEVPLIVKLPASLGIEALQPGETVGNHRIFSTLVELAGGERRAETVVSLLEESAEPVLSELYLGNGTNTWSMVDGDEQLVWHTNFADAEPDYFRARLEEMGLAADRPTAGGSAALFRRLDRFFAHVPVLRGLPGRPPRVDRWEWREGGTVPTGDAPRGDVRRLESLWSDLNGDDQAPAETSPREAPELSDEDLERLRALGYVGGRRDP